MSNGQQSKKARRAAAREHARVAHEQQVRRTRRTKILVRVGAVVGALALLVGVGFGVVLANAPAGPGPANMASGGAVFAGADGTAQIVETPAVEPDGETTPTDVDALEPPTHVTTYVDFNCVHCQTFELANGDQLEELVASGEASLEVVPVALLGAYSERAASAASCVAALQPESFFDMLGTMFEQQQPGGSAYTNAEILDLWEQDGIQASDELAACVTEERFGGWIEDRTGDVVSDPDLQNPATGGFGTPTVFVDGERYEGPLDQPEVLADFIAASGSPASS